MLRPIALLTAACLLAVALAPAPLVGAPSGEAETHPTRVNIGFHGDVPPDIEVRIALHGGTHRETERGLSLVVAEAASAEQQDAFIAAMQGYPDTRYAVPDLYMEMAHVPNDPKFQDGTQWGPQKIGADVVWDTYTGAGGPLIGLLDSLVECDHEDLQGVCAPGSDTGRDPCTHGTKVVGALAARMDNGVGIAGITQGQVLTKDWHPTINGNTCIGLLSNVAITLLRLASNDKVRIISMSVTAPCLAPNLQEYACKPLREAIREAHDKGILLVAAAGNTSTNQGCGAVAYPAAWPEAIAVGALAKYPENTRQRSSACGPEVDLIAPGDQIYTTYVAPDQYTNGGQTSLATPHVSGAAHLVWGYCPGLTNTQVRSLLEDHAQDLGLPSDEQGHGLVRVDLAFEAARTHPDCGHV